VALARWWTRRWKGEPLSPGYWITPLPPPGPIGFVCEWPAVEIAVARQQIDAQLIRGAAEKARAMFGDGHHVLRDGRAWRLGADADAAWINDETSAGNTITSAIPPVFACYCTQGLPEANDPAGSARHEQAVIELLTAHTTEQPWWLGYLDTGASDVVFPYAPRTMVYSGYGYVLVEAGPQQAAEWREEGFNWTLPDLMFPADRSWLVSTRWTTAGPPSVGAGSWSQQGHHGQFGTRSDPRPDPTSSIFNVRDIFRDTSGLSSPVALADHAGCDQRLGIARQGGRAAGRRLLLAQGSYNQRYPLRLLADLEQYARRGTRWL
jgi:hypothetical protein